MNTFKRVFKVRKIIGVGSRRIVYDLGNGKVLKLAKSKFGIKSNKIEVKLYQSSSYNIKKNLAEIFSYNSRYRWLIMKKYTRKIPKTKAYKKRIFKLKHEFKRHGIIPYEITTRYKKPNYKNISLKSNGQIVVLDFGNFKYLSSTPKRKRTQGSKPIQNNTPTEPFN
ncbi:hypothetical protein PaeBR_11490 [Paenibacillus sp. BR2-3]|uniref:hypothetical protein n=1 Tax=Paenibacillus sp. BR2-3 TaxID=3048494 RepID=UPI003977BDD0